MIKVKVAVLDDELSDLNKVVNYFNKVSNHNLCYRCTCFDSVQNFYDSCYDLYILDIEMPEITGLKVADTIKEKYPHAVIILHSKRNDLVFESFKVGVFFFVRKDHFEEDMDYARVRLDQHFKENNQLYHYQNKDIIKNIPHHEIAYIEKVSHHVEIHLSDGSVLRDNTSMRNILSQFSSFISCHQSYLVNLNYVSSLEGNDFIMKNGDRIQISKRNLTKVKHAYILYLNKKVIL